ncbi:hypothetical protein C4D60_Mb08t17190 [Musa balbisiana]|uniref:Uncharacterized protein n=1 Tax=Musa balbisiana TaxID=52838 RepID=A0A4S8K4G8_MUSBA|nr:hypothetical protein C4D60_Mb08t17190 [Musa balbisiana]
MCCCNQVGVAFVRRCHCTMRARKHETNKESKHTLPGWGFGNSEMLEIREQFLRKKMAAEVEKAKEFTRANNKRVDRLGNYQLQIHDQIILLEVAKSTTETVDALRTGTAATKAILKDSNIDDMYKTMDEINEQTQEMKQIQEALSAPVGAAADFDEVSILRTISIFFLIAVFLHVDK